MIIELAKRRVYKGTIWYRGDVCCTRCGDTHLAVVPMPTWTPAPPPVECNACGAISCLAVGDAMVPGAWTPPDVGERLGGRLAEEVD
jgi:hypothetical protein